MDRKAAIMSGRFKGRQLFAAADETSAEESSLSLSYSGGGGDICSDWMSGIQEREVMVSYELSSDFSDSCSLPAEKAAVEVAEKRGGGRRRVVAAASLGAVLIVLALVLCFLSCNGNNFEELIPT